MDRASERLVDKEEPQFVAGVPAEKMEILLALNWYSQNREKEHSHKYLKSYCKEHGIAVTEGQISIQVPTLGFVARMLARSVVLDQKSMDWFHLRMSQMQAYIPEPSQPKPAPKPVEKVKKVKVEKSVEAPVAKVPKKRKYISPEAQVKYIKYLENDKGLGVKSVDPIKIVGATTLWTYHTPSRMLTHYVAQDDKGLMVNRCSIENFSITTSKAKKLRKPEMVLPKVIQLSNGALKGLLNELTTKDARVTGRVNSQTIIVKVTI